MHSFPDLIKKIREEAELTQTEFAKKIDVSPVLVAMVETGQKPISKKMIEKIAEKLEVHPASITPFLYLDQDFSYKKLGKLERLMIEQAERLQDLLIEKKSKLLR